MKRYAIATLAGVAAGVLGPGCVNTSPLPFEEQQRDGGYFVDAGGEGGVVATCRECVTSESSPCRSQYLTCQKREQCSVFLGCLLDIGCLTLPELQQRIDCGTPCFQKAGIASGTDPALTAALDVNVCTQDRAGCLRECTP